VTKKSEFPIAAIPEMMLSTPPTITSTPREHRLDQSSNLIDRRLLLSMIGPHERLGSVSSNAPTFDHHGVAPGHPDGLASARSTSSD